MLSGKAGRDTDGVANIFIGRHRDRRVSDDTGYAILFDPTRVAPPRTRTPNLSAEDMLRTYELAASGSLMPVGDNTWSKKSAFASVPPSKVIEAQFVNVN